MEAPARQRRIEFQIEKIRTRNALEITKENRYTMGALPLVVSKLKRWYNNEETSSYVMTGYICLVYYSNYSKPWIERV